MPCTQCNYHGRKWSVLLRMVLHLWQERKLVYWRDWVTVLQRSIEPGNWYFYITYYTRKSCVKVCLTWNMLWIQLWKLLISSGRSKSQTVYHTSGRLRLWSQWCSVSYRYYAGWVWGKPCPPPPDFWSLRKNLLYLNNLRLWMKILVFRNQQD